MFKRHDKKCLPPLFGTYCMTERFGNPHPRGQAEHIHFEAWLDDPVKKSWTVTRVTEAIDDKQHLSTKAKTVKSKLPFDEALSLLAQEEIKAKKSLTTLLPVAADMEYLHFKAFAEREGYIFDKDGIPHARPALDAIPADAGFTAADIASANRHVQRPPHEFSADTPVANLPQSHFLFDFIAHTKHLDHHAERMNELRVLDLLDHYVSHIKEMRRNLGEYVDGYANGDNSHLIGKAEDALKMSDYSLQQLKAYHVDTQLFESFNRQCRLTCLIIHAEGLYKQMQAGKIDVTLAEPVFKTCVKEAEEMLKTIDPSAHASELLKSVIVQNGPLILPASIDAFIDGYDSHKKNFYAHKPPSPPQP